MSISIKHLPIMLALCQHNGATYYAQNYAGIIGALKPKPYASLSTIVLNSRDWSEIVWLPEISRFKTDLAIGFIRKKLAGIHWLGYN